MDATYHDLRMAGKGCNQGEEKQLIQFLLGTLKTCSRTYNLERGKRIHADYGHACNIYVVNALINMYTKCGSMDDARDVFDGIKHPTVVSWTTLILGYAENGQGHTALDFFTKMRAEGSAPNAITLVAAIKAIAVKCQWAEWRDRGKAIHNFALEIDCHSVIYLQNSLIDMYSKCGSMFYARQVFDGIKQPTIVSWNVLILGYADNGQGQTSLDMFTRMRTKGTAPDSVTLIAALKACTSLADNLRCMDYVKKIHNIVVECDCNSDVYVENYLVDMYAKCSSMVNSREMFEGIKQPTVVCWTALIFGYVGNGQGQTALEIFVRMKFEGAVSNSVTIVAALRACTCLAASGWAECRGKAVHNIAVAKGCDSDVNVQNSLVDMYAKFGRMVDAQGLFDLIKHPTLVSWTVLILGYADNGQGHTAFNLFTLMISEGHTLDCVAVVAALKACTSLVVTEGSSGWPGCRTRGKALHSIAIENGCNFDVYVQNSLADMYAKCSSMRDACEVFENMRNPTLVSWNVLIMGYADNCQGCSALDMFTRMRNEGPFPDSVTFGAVLKACGLVGALEFGKTIHSELDSRKLDIILVNCLVDFYAKCGNLVEAQGVFNSHPGKRDQITWSALLAGFSNCGDSDSVFEMFEEMLDAGFKPDNVTFLCILACCSHAGLVVKGKECFDSMSPKYGVIPTAKHYDCMIDLFGRANKLDDAVALMEHMPCSPNAVTWLTILSACHKWRNVKIGELAFQSLIDLNGMDSAAYILMGQIYGSSGMLEEQATVMGLRKRLKEYKTLGETCWTNERGDVHTFSVEEKLHPQIQEIRYKWESMGLMMKQKAGSICGHTERMALVCALINTEPGKTVRIVKNLRVCDDCHTAIAQISRLECRSIICRDACRIHFFQGGKCSCGDFW